MLTKEFMDSHLHFESIIPVFLVDRKILSANEGYKLIQSFCTENVPEGYVFEAFLTNVLVIGDVDAYY